MKGYYHFDVYRKTRRKSSFNYTLQLNKYIVDEVNIEELNRLVNLKDEERPANLTFAGTFEFLKISGLKVKPVFEIPCNYPTGMRILIGLSEIMPSGSVLRRWFRDWNEPLSLVNNAPEMSLTNEEFLVLLQQALNNLPKRTFSQKNKQKVIEAFMASF